MNSLSDIQFYEVLKKRPKGVKKTKWVRRTHKDKEFNEKVRVIRMRAAVINDKIANY